jgi:hypothetical protein
LDRAENLALLGHELTHVAASGNAPVQRSVRATGDLPVVQRQGEVGNTGQPTNQAQSVAMPMRPLLPATIQRTLAGEESVAAGVEEGLRTFLRQSSQSTGEVSQPVGASINRSSLPVVQRTPLAPRTTIRPGGAERIQRLAAVDESDSALPRLGVSPIQLKGFRGGEPTLSGVPSDVMAVAPRTPIVRRMPAEVESSAPDISRSSTLDPLAIRPPSSAPIVQRAPSGDESPKRSSSSTSSVSSTQESPQTQSADPASDQDADWDRLAEKVYPLIRRMLQLERERRPR